MHICSNCKFKTDQSYKFCPQCGHSGMNPIEYPSAHAHYSPNDSVASDEVFPQGYAPHGKVKQSFQVPAWLKSNKFKLFSAIGVGAIVIIVAVIVALNVFLNKNPKELYMYAELQTYQAQQNNSSLFGEADTAMFEKLKKIASDTTITLSGDVALHAKDVDEEFNEIAKSINNGAIELNIVQNPKDKWGQIGLKVSKEKDSIVDALFMYYDDIFAIKGIGELDKMHYASLDEIQKLYKGESIEESEEELPEISEEQLKQLEKKFKSFLITHLKDEYFTLEKNVTYNTSEGEVKAKKITISINEKEVKSLMIAFIDELRSDKDVQELIALYSLQFMGSNYYNLTKTEQLEYLKEQIEDGLYEMKREVVSSAALGSFEMELYLTKNNMIMDREITVSFEQEYSSNRLEINLHQTNWDLKKSDDKSTFDIEIAFYEYGKKSSLNWTSETTTTIKNKIRDSNSEITISTTSYGSTDFTADVNWRARESTIKGGEDRYTFEIEITSIADAPKINGDFKRKVDQNLAKNYSNQAITGSMDITVMSYGERESLTIGFDLATKTTFNDGLAKPVLDSDAVNVSELDEVDSYYMIQRMIYNLEDYLPTYNYY